MKGPLRVQFFKWLALEAAMILVAMAVVLAVYNRREVLVYHHAPIEEDEELVIMLLSMLGLAPVSVGVAWVLSGRLLKPISSMLETAENIRAGDLTERVRTELPDDELGRLGHTINEAFDRYQESLERLERFSYDASHQLRTPLAAIRANAEVCLSRTRTPAEYAETLGKVLEEVSRLSRTVEQLLTLARLSPVQIAAAFHDVNVSELAREVAGEFKPVAEMQSIALAIDDSAGAVVARGVRELLREAVHNVLDNAMRVTPPGGRVDVVVMNTPNGVRIQVGDSGPGLPQEGRELTLRSFRRGEGSGRGDGHGLGLAIVSDVVAAHRGTVTVDSSPLGGAQFTITLPVAG